MIDRMKARAITMQLHELRPLEETNQSKQWTGSFLRWQVHATVCLV